MHDFAVVLKLDRNSIGPILAHIGIINRSSRVISPLARLASSMPSCRADPPTRSRCQFQHVCSQEKKKTVRHVSRSQPAHKSGTLTFFPAAPHSSSQGKTRFQPASNHKPPDPSSDKRAQIARVPIGSRPRHVSA